MPWKHTFIPAAPAVVFDGEEHGRWLEASSAQLAEQLFVERDRVESAPPADLSPVIRLDLAQHLPARLRRRRNHAVVGPGALGEIQVRGPEQGIGLQPPAASTTLAYATPCASGTSRLNIAIPSVVRSPNPVRSTSLRSSRVMRPNTAWPASASGVPRCGAPMVTSEATLSARPSREIAYRASRPPMLCATMFTRGSGTARIKSASRAARAEIEEAGGTLGQ